MNRSDAVLFPDKFVLFLLSSLAICFVICFFVSGCGGSGNDGSDLSSDPYSASRLEAEMNTILSEIGSTVDFSFAVETEDGRKYTFSRGGSTMQTSYESASTSKLVTAVVILGLVEQGFLSLAGTPQSFIENWPVKEDSPLYNLTLAHLLNLTSGLETEPLCLNAGWFDFEDCVVNIGNINADNDIIPGQRFYYSGTHMQVAGLMAVKASGVSSWSDVFDEFKSRTGLFPNSIFDLPSVTNPRLGGGMHWTGEEYMDFLAALCHGNLLGPESMQLLLSDHTASALIVLSPILSGLGENWHYGFGLWHECRNPVFNCSAGERVSSPGAYGSYPFWDQEKGYFGLVARKGALGTFIQGIEIERAVRSRVEQWVLCE